MDTATKDLLSKELLKARKRHAEQAAVLASTEAIIASSLSLPSLKAIAARRLPKLRSVLQETAATLGELEKALEVPVNTDIESVAPAVPLKKQSSSSRS